MVAVWYTPPFKPTQAHCSSLLSLAQVNNFDLANSLDLLAQLETEQTGHRKHLQQVMHALGGATVDCRGLQRQTSRTSSGSHQLLQ